MSGQEIQVFLGDVISSDASAQTASYVLQLQALVLNAGGNQAGTPLVNQGTVGFVTSLQQAVTTAPALQPSVVTEPNVQVVKAAEPLSLLTTGGTVTFTVTVTNVGGPFVSAAYDVHVTDTPAAPYGGLTVVSVTPNAQAMGVTDASTTQMLDVSVDLLRPGGQVVIVYQASVPPLAAGTRLPNTAVATWTSEPGPQGTANATPGAPGSDTGERTGDVTGANDYLTSDIASVVVGAVNMTKSIVAPQARYAIGDPVTYQVDLAIPAFATLTNASVSDALAAGLAYQPGSLTVGLSPDVIATAPLGDFTVTTDAAGAQTLTLGFGALTNTANASRTITLTYTAIVANVLTNQDGHVLMNQATFFFDDPGTGLPTSQLAETMLTVGEPRLALSKTITGPAVGLDAGDSVAFRVDVSNTGTTTAFDTVLADTLPPGLEQIQGLAVLMVTGGAESPVLTNGGTSWSTSAFDIPAGGAVAIVFTARLCLRRDAGRAAPERRRCHLHEPLRQRPERA